VLNKGEKHDILETKTDKTLGLCVYPYWHPQSRYVAFSTNTTRQEFHVVKDERIEVFDYESDLQVLDTETHELILSPIVTEDSINETYPAFSPDGHTIYFCSARKRSFPLETKDVRYNLCSIAFDAKKGAFGPRIDTLVYAEADSLSVAFPKPSYDGKYIMYTQASYGTFPIWHKEADLCLLNLKTGQARTMDEVNSEDTDSYHNWSDNSHWFVFSSRRGDGLYTRLYISSIDENGKATKPFLLPQKNPRHYYERLMYSYNVPDFTKAKVDINSRVVANEILSEKRTVLSVRQ
jgi:Tol biopolymer transport system component